MANIESIIGNFIMCALIGILFLGGISFVVSLFPELHNSRFSAYEQCMMGLQHSTQKQFEQLETVCKFRESHPDSKLAHSITIYFAVINYTSYKEYRQFGGNISYFHNGIIEVTKSFLKSRSRAYSMIELPTVNGTGFIVIKLDEIDAISCSTINIDILKDTAMLDGIDVTKWRSLIEIRYGDKNDPFRFHTLNYFDDATECGRAVKIAISEVG